MSFVKKSKAIVRYTSFISYI
uniref:Uncharacterized protein n=1 Tax=Arundo donax TaxID=35708 RepID=A0A0A8YBF8_ARUDO